MDSLSGEKNLILKFFFQDCSTQTLQSANKFSVLQQRISHICRSLTKMELRIVLDAFDEACNTLIIEPASFIFHFI